eukprot:COSAG02_NODE_2459_length_8804_cov_3.707295_3_plen_52_part_00
MLIGIAVARMKHDVAIVRKAVGIRPYAHSLESHDALTAIEAQHILPTTWHQ